MDNEETPPPKRPTRGLSPKVRWARTLYVTGDPVTGRRVLSIQELSEITGAKVEAIYEAKKREKWDDMAEAKSMVIFQGMHIKSGVFEHIDKSSEAIQKKLNRQLTILERIDNTHDDFSKELSKFERIYNLWKEMSGAKAQLDAQNIYFKELGKLKAQAEAKAAEEKARRNEVDDGQTLDI